MEPTIASVSRFGQAVVAERAQAVEILAEAVSELERSRTRLDHAWALVDLGAALRRDNRLQARKPLTRGLELARDCGAGSLLEQADEELAATGARPRSGTLSGADALTASERRIAQMAAEGRTNREIAQALFVTQKTVEMHLSNAYRKLDVSSRRELPARLASVQESPAGGAVAPTEAAGPRKG